MRVPRNMLTIVMAGMSILLVFAGSSFVASPASAATVTTSNVQPAAKPKPAPLTQADVKPNNGLVNVDPLDSSGKSSATRRDSKRTGDSYVTTGFDAGGPWVGMVLTNNKSNWVYNKLDDASSVRDGIIVVCGGIVGLSKKAKFWPLLVLAASCVVVVGLKYNQLKKAATSAYKGGASKCLELRSHSAGGGYVTGKLATVKTCHYK